MLKRLLVSSGLFVVVSVLATAAYAKGGSPAPTVAPLSSTMGAGVQVYSTSSAFQVAVTSTVVDDFEGVASGSNGQDAAVFQDTYVDANGTTFYSPMVGSNTNMTIEGTQYGYNAQGYGAVGRDFGSDVLSTNYYPLTITFAQAVNAFSIDFGALGTAFANLTTPTVFTFTVDGITGSATEGNYGGLSFFGLTSDTAFTSVTVSNAFAGQQYGGNQFLDNVTYQAAPAASASDVPEPASWALMLSGFGMVGATIRRRRAAVRFA